jgi:tetratricopeptide (TPR) repeat protein
LERSVDATGNTLIDFKARLEVAQKELADTRLSGATNDIPTIQQRIKALQTRIEATQKRGDNSADLQKKQEELQPILADLLDFQKAWESGWEPSDDPGSKKLARAKAQFVADIQTKLKESTSYASMYQLIGQELYVAKRLLASENPEHGRIGLSTAMQASYNALDYAQNGWLAARICEGYIWPHLDLATDANRRSPYNLEYVLNQCGTVFRQSEETNNTIRNIEMLLAFAKTPTLADNARAQLGRFYAQNGDTQEALKYFKQIKNTNDPSFRMLGRQIAQLEQQLKKK